MKKFISFFYLFLFLGVEAEVINIDLVDILKNKDGNYNKLGLLLMKDCSGGKNVDDRPLLKPLCDAIHGGQEIVLYEIVAQEGGVNIASFILRDEFGKGKALFLPYSEASEGTLRIHPEALIASTTNRMKANLILHLDVNTEEHSRRFMEKHHEKVLEDLKSKGVSSNQLFAVQEDFQPFPTKKKPSTSSWKEWVDSYNPEILSSPVIINLDDDIISDASTPIGALKLLYKGLYSANLTMIKKCTDERGWKILKKKYALKEGKEGEKIITYDFPPFLNMLTVLMEAEYTDRNDYEYTLLLVRRHNEGAVRDSDWVALSSVVFIRKDDRYIYTDVTSETSFGNPNMYAGFLNGAGMYDEFVKMGQESEYPRYFYDPKLSAEKGEEMSEE